ncbi:Mu transposase domain-containing protein [Thermaerobacter litoralis]
MENGVGYGRRNALVPVPDVSDWEALNAHLLAWCERERQRRGEAWEQERAALRPLPDRPFRAARPHVVTVNKLSLVTFDRNRYSVPCEWVGRTLTLWAYTDRIEVTDGERLVVAHSRVYGRGETPSNWPITFRPWPASRGPPPTWPSCPSCRRSMPRFSASCAAGVPTGMASSPRSSFFTGNFRPGR